MPKLKLTSLTIIFAVIAGMQSAHAELIEYDDSTSNMIAATHIISNGATGWNDPTIHVGEVFGFRYHILIGIRDTTTLQTLFDEHTLDSAMLSIVISSLVGSPGALNLHAIRRDSTGVGVYPAYDDSRSYYCRSEWIGRKAALPSACPASIDWEAPGATGDSDFDSIPFTSLSSPAPGQRFELNVTPWIHGIINGIDSISNGIILLAENEDGVGTDYMSVRSIRPFFAGDDRMILRIWRSQPASKPNRAWLESPDMLK